jgi:SAM-dependent methyltransferase
MDVTNDGTDVKGLVREHYGERARRASAGPTLEMCCGPSAIYSPLELQGLPQTVTAASAGCGDPTALAGIVEGEVVLDLGSGGGIDCFIASRQTGESGRILGVDMTLDMVRLAKGNARKLRVSNVDFMLGELEHLPLASGSVDVVLSNCVINLSTDKDAVFREAFRVLKPGGRLHVSDIVLDRDLPDDVRRDAEQLVGCIAGADLQDVYLDRVRRAGFADVSTREAVPYDCGGLAGVVSAKVEAARPPG